MKLNKVLIMAGGTGGHVFPGLAVAEYLKQKNIEVHWLGTPEGLEARLVPATHIYFHSIHIKGFRGKKILMKIFAPFRALAAISQALYLIWRIKPDVVLGMGGFVSGPGGVASWLLRRPLIIHEQNAKAGLTNKILAAIATKILAAFPEAFSPQARLSVVGNPVRADLIAFLPPRFRLPAARQPMHLLVLGGSLGAQALNELLPQALSRLSIAERPEVWHQTGEKHFATAVQAYEQAQVKVKLSHFIDNMAAAYDWADVVLCRAGALTVSELCAVGVGAILVPYPYAVDDHQAANAEFMVRNHAALCLRQAGLSPEKLADILRELVSKPAWRIAMAEAAFSVRSVNATAAIADICEEVCL